MFPIVFLALFSCGDDGEDVIFTTDNLSLSDRTIIIEATGTSARLTVTANCQWTAELGNDRWEGLTINTTDGYVDIVTTPNDKTQARTATLSVMSQSGALTRTVTLQQNGSDVSLSVSTENIQLPAKTTDTGSSVTFTVTCNTAWTISGGADWLEYSPVNGNGGTAETVTVTLTKDNSEEAEHNAMLSVTSGSVTRNIQVKQAAKVIELTASQKIYDVAAKDGQCQVEIHCNHSWTVQNSSTWLTVSPTSGQNDGQVNVVCQENTGSDIRTAILTFFSGSKQEEITIRQASSNAPELNELVLSNVSKTQATASCSFTSLFEVSEYGFCYSSSNEQPTIDDMIIKHEGNSMSGTFEDQITGLSSGQTYYVRAFARSKSGVGYSKVKQFTTAGRKPNEDDNGEPNL